MSDPERRLAEHEFRIAALERDRDRDQGVFMRRDVYEIGHRQLVEADAAQDLRIDELFRARAADVRRNLAILVSSLVAVIGTIAAALILRSLGG